MASLNDEIRDLIIELRTLTERITKIWHRMEIETTPMITHLPCDSCEEKEMKIFSQLEELRAVRTSEEDSNSQ